MENIGFWYSATNGFLSVVQPKRLDDLLDALQINLTQIDNANAVLQKLQQNWPELAYYSMGYIVCLGIGLLLLLIMPIVGCCMCCCRSCCGKCGARIAPPGEKDKCRRVTYSAFVILLSTLSLLSLGCAFVANNKMRVQTKIKGGALSRMSTGFVVLDRYKNQTLDDIEDGLFVPLRVTNNNISNLLTAVPAAASAALAERTKADQPLSALANFAVSMDILKKNYESIDNITLSLQEDGRKLESNLSAIRSEINVLLRGCKLSACFKMNSTISGLVPDSNFSTIDVTNIQYAIISLQHALRSGFPERVNNSVMQFENITASIQRETGQHLDQVKNKMKEVTTSAEEQFKDITDKIKKENIAAFSSVFSQRAPMVDSMGQYVSLAFNGLIALLLLIVVLNVLGVFFGAVCQLPGDGATCCSSRCGADCLLAGTGFAFIFYWLFIVLTMVLFLSGGLVRNEACRYATGEPEVNSSIRKLDKYVGDAIQTALNLSSPISVMNAVQKCEQDKSMYQALNIEAFGINISKLLDLKEHGVDKLLDQLRNTTITIGRVDIINGPLNESLYNLTTGLDAVNLSLFDIELKKDVVKGNLQDFINNLRSVNNASFDEEANKLMDLKNTAIPKIKQDRTELTLNIHTANNIARNTRLTEISANLTKSQVTLNTEGKEILRGIINQTSLAIWNVLYDVTSGMADDVRNEIGRCRSVYEAVVQIVEPLCVRVLYPFNALWFSFGACLFLFIPIMIFGVKLAGLLRKVGNASKVSQGPDLKMSPLRKQERKEALNFKTACEHGEGGPDTISIRCPYPTMIDVRYAVYGRLDACTCAERKENIGCYANGSMAHVRHVCQKKGSCTLKANNNVFGDPCPGVGKYLKVGYLCVF